MFGGRPSVDRFVRRVRGAYRRRAVAAAAVWAVAVALALVAAAWALAAAGAWRRPSGWPLALWAGAGALWGAVGWLGLRWLRRFGLAAAARAVEELSGSRPGAVRAAVELAQRGPGVSASLAERYREWVSVRLAAVGRVSAAGSSAFAAQARHLRAAALAASAAAVAVGAFARARPELGPVVFDGLAHPRAYLRPLPLPPLRLAVEATEVPRGADVAVSVEAAGRDSVWLRWRPRAEVARRRALVVAEGRAHGAVPRVEAPTQVWAEAPDGARTDTVELLPVDPLLLAELRVELRFPRYTGRAAELIEPPWPPLAVPEGTRLHVEGRANRAVAEAWIRGVDGAPDYRLLPRGAGFAGAWTARTGRWTWEVRAATGEALAAPPDTLEVRVVADSAPTVAIVYPGVDTTLHVEMVQPLVIDARDDYGLSRAELVSWRVSAWGESHAPRVEALPVSPEAGPRVVFEPLLDARGRGFFPGDTLRYFARVWDNAPEPQMGRTREYVLRLPTFAELRDRSRAEVQEAVARARELAESARERAREAQALERSTREGGRASRESPSPGGRDPGGADFEETRDARRALAEGERLAEQVAEVRRALEEVERALERAGLDDPELAQRIEELRAIYERVLTPELEARLEALRRALTELDPEAIREAVRRLAESTLDLREQIERSLKLLERVALEQEFAALAADARELARQERAAAEAARRAAERRDASAAEEWRRRAADARAAADSLSARLPRFAESLESAGEPEMARQVEEARPDVDRSAEGAAEALQRERAPRAAAESLERGAEAAERAAGRLDRAREAMARSWRRRVEEALERAQVEALELSEQQRHVAERLQSASRSDDVRVQAAALQRGLDAMAQALSTASEGTLLLDPAVMGSLRRAGRQMRELLESLGQANPSPELSREHARAALEALNDLALTLMENRESVARGGSGTGFQEALERLGELAQGQGQLSEQARGLLPLQLPGQALAQRMRQLAEQQRGIARRLQELGRELGGRGEVLGRVDRLGEEAERIARELERGRLTPDLVRRQEELFHRLLDAGRTLERDDQERERRAERPSEVSVFRAGPLPADALRGPRYPRPGDAELRRYAPPYRRLILDYFDALNRARERREADRAPH
jgi:hypothetical protein